MYVLRNDVRAGLIQAHWNLRSATSWKRLIDIDINKDIDSSLLLMVALLSYRTNEKLEIPSCRPLKLFILSTRLHPSLFISHSIAIYRTLHS